MQSDNFNNYCESLLDQYNRRNTQATRRHIDGLCNILRQEGNHMVQPMFGGSVGRRTYVNGLSDVDVLLIVNQSSLVNQPPPRVIEYVRDTIRRRLPSNSVSAGRLAVTVGYSDGTEIQILPAIRTNSGGVRIACPGSTRWSNILQPDRFAEELIQVNQANGGRVLPTIKLAKAMADCFITNQYRKISSFHMEALAIDAFRNYTDDRDHKSMLVHFLGYSMRAVMSPIADPTGQSRHVDEYLGQSGSLERKRASTYFGQMRGEVNRCVTRAQFNKLFCVN